MDVKVLTLVRSSTEKVWGVLIFFIGEKLTCLLPVDYEVVEERENESKDGDLTRVLKAKDERSKAEIFEIRIRY